MPMQRKLLSQQPYLARHRPCVPRRLGRRITAFAGSSQEGGFEQVLETGTAIGSVTFNVLMDEAVDVAADVSRVQAEQFKILTKFPQDPQGTVNELLQDIQSRGVPSVSDLMQRTATVMGSIQTRVDEKLAPAQMGAQGQDVVDETIPPQMPDPQELAADVQAEAAATRDAVKKSVADKKI